MPGRLPVTPPAARARGARRRAAHRRRRLSGGRGGARGARPRRAADRRRPARRRRRAVPAAVTTSSARRRAPSSAFPTTRCSSSACAGSCRARASTCSSTPPRCLRHRVPRPRRRHRWRAGATGRASNAASPTHRVRRRGLLGRVDDDDLPAFYGCADVFASRAATAGSGSSRRASASSSSKRPRAACRRSRAAAAASHEAVVRRRDRPRGRRPARRRARWPPRCARCSTTPAPAPAWAPRPGAGPSVEFAYDAPGARGSTPRCWSSEAGVNDRDRRRVVDRHRAVRGHRGRRRDHRVAASGRRSSWPSACSSSAPVCSSPRWSSRPAAAASEEIGMGGLFFLAGLGAARRAAAPARVARRPGRRGLRHRGGPALHEPGLRHPRARVRPRPDRAVGARHGTFGPGRPGATGLTVPFAVQWVVLVVGLEFPAIVALLDCCQPRPDQFDGGADDRGAWLQWLVDLAAAVPVLRRLRHPARLLLGRRQAHELR